MKLNKASNIINNNRTEIIKNNFNGYYHPSFYILQEIPPTLNLSFERDGSMYSGLFVYMVLFYMDRLKYYHYMLQLKTIINIFDH